MRIVHNPLLVIVWCDCCSWTIQFTGQSVTSALVYAVSSITFTSIPLVIYVVYFSVVLTDIYAIIMWVCLL